ncbi:MAG: hypothetical protein JNM18_19825 [Planctomycetaceae bacterium]|nr:hypothetical protein [Planctomycetaceae bacterium]
MSQPESNEIRVSILSYVNIYTTMLMLSLLAMVIAVVLLVLELSSLDWDKDARSISQLDRSRAIEIARLV